MSRVITFSRFFPATHPRKGEPTYFVEHIWDSLMDAAELSMSKVVELSRSTGIGELDFYKLRATEPQPKHHTIRAGNRWKVGDKFSPRVWSGKPYASKQIIIAPDIEIKKIWNIGMTWGDYSWFISHDGRPLSLDLIAKNDGLETSDFKSWFHVHKRTSYGSFAGQILCWNESINY